MNKLTGFLLFDGIFVFVCLILFFLMYRRKSRETHFRDDIWKEEGKVRRQAYEDQLDKKILLEHRADPAEQEGEKSPTSEEKSLPSFKVPNFSGSPHEILGIPSNASDEIIGAAFRHWMKRYHPDRVSHLGKQYVEQARRRAEQLNTARTALLQNKK